MKHLTWFFGGLVVATFFTIPTVVSAYYEWVYESANSIQNQGGQCGYIGYTQECDRYYCRFDETNSSDPVYKECNETTLGTRAVDYLCEGYPWTHESEVYYICAWVSEPVVASLTAVIDSGSGTVTGNGINCPGDCSETYSTPPGWLTVFAEPSDGYNFSHWGAGFCEDQTSICSNSLDSGSEVARANFVAISPPTVTINADPNPVGYNTPTTLYWSSNADSCFLGSPYSFWSHSGGPSGSVLTDNITYDRTFFASCYGPGGSGTDSVLVSVSASSPLTATCAPSLSAALIGQVVSWRANVTGTSPAYSWSGTNIPTNPAPSTNPFGITYGTIGQKEASVRVTDGSGSSINVSCSPVRIYFNPKFEEF